MGWDAGEQRRQQQREEQRRQQQREEQRRLDQQREQRRVEDARLRTARERDEDYARLDAAAAERRAQEAAAAATAQRKRDEDLRQIIAQAKSDWEDAPEVPRGSRRSTASQAQHEVNAPPSAFDGSGASSQTSEMKQVLAQAAAAVVLAAATAGWAKFKSRRKS